MRLVENKGEQAEEFIDFFSSAKEGELFCKLGCALLSIRREQLHFLKLLLD